MERGHWKQGSENLSVFLVWSSIWPFPGAHGHLNHSLEKLVAGLSLKMESTVGISNTQRTSCKPMAAKQCLGPLA